MRDGEGWYWILGIILAAFLVVIFGFHSQAMSECDKKGGVLVRSGFSNACVEEK